MIHNTISSSVWLIWIPFISVCFKRELVFEWGQIQVIKLKSKFGIFWSSSINTFFILQWYLLEHQYAEKYTVNGKTTFFLLYGIAPTILALFLSYQALVPKHGSLLKILAISIEWCEPFLNLLITDLMHNN